MIDAEYSSIVCFVGTNRGHVATFKILPSGSGYSASFVGSSSSDDKIISICPMDAETGNLATASQSAFAELRNGYRLNGVVIAVTPSNCRIFKPANAKGAHKNWDEFMCDSASIVKTDRGHSLVGLFGDGKGRAYSIPALKEISSLQLSDTLDVRRFGEAQISPTGSILGWVGPSELSMVHVWGAGSPLYAANCFQALTYYGC